MISILTYLCICKNVVVEYSGFISYVVINITESFTFYLPQVNLGSYAKKNGVVNGEHRAA
jgi:hypothetical protein